jgi:hypothetical protein
MQIGGASTDSISLPSVMSDPPAGLQSTGSSSMCDHAACTCEHTAVAVPAQMFMLWHWPTPVKIAPIEHDPLGLKARPQPLYMFRTSRLDRIAVVSSTCTLQPSSKGCRGSEL